jgi:hypothetical protein
VSTAASPVATATIVTDNGPLDAVSVKIPSDRASALAMYGDVKAAVRAQFNSLPRDASEAGGADAYVKTHESYVTDFRFPMMLLWDRIARVHQGGQGMSKRTPAYERWLGQRGIK